MDRRQPTYTTPDGRTYTVRPDGTYILRGPEVGTVGWLNERRTGLDRRIVERKDVN